MFITEVMESISKGGRVKFSASIAVLIAGQYMISNKIGGKTIPPLDAINTIKNQTI